jgi:uncharacterized protein YxeA
MKSSIAFMILSIILMIGCSATFFQSGNADVKMSPEDSLSQSQDYQSYEEILEESKETLEETVLEPVIEPDPRDPNIF